MRTLPIVVTCLLLPGIAAAAVLRPFTRLGGSVVTVADLWDDTGQTGTRALGPAPAPGERIVVGAAQLAAIARQFGVDWRPASPAERSVLERPGAPLPRTILTTALQAALAAAGAPDGDLDMPQADLPMVAPDAMPHLSVEQLTWHADERRFAASVAIVTADAPTVRVQIAGRVIESLPALVASHRLAAGHVIVADDLQPGRVRRERLHAPLLKTADEAIGRSVRRPTQTGEPLTEELVSATAAVDKGANVTVTLTDGGLAARVAGRAMETGAIGAHIRVMNPVSRAVLLAEVTGPGAVAVTPGSAPLPGDVTGNVAPVP